VNARRRFRPSALEGLESRFVLSGLGLLSAAKVVAATTKFAIGGVPIRIPSVGTNSSSIDIDHQFTLSYGGLTRRYVVHVPAGYNGKTPLPVVLGFHGGLGNAVTFAVQSHLDTLSDEQGFLVVYPDGTGPNKNALYWNSGPDGGYATAHNIDDVGFINALLNKLPQQFPIDTSRVYATGISNGAMMCYRLAHELSNRITAIAPVAGQDMMLDGQTPSRPVPVIDFNGMLDTVAPYAGGAGPFQGIEHPSVAQVISQWVAIDHDQSSPVSVVTTADYIETSYAPAPGTSGAPVVLYTLPDGGHTWPGGTVIDTSLNLGPLVTTVDASSIAWQFFKQFSLPMQPGSSPQHGLPIKHPIGRRH
jgi:polyhydroxybutyrate depolymerase